MNPGYKWFKTSGIISPEKWGNLPGGECFTSPGEVNGTFVVDGVVGDWLCARYGLLAAPRSPSRSPATASSVLLLQRKQAARADFWAYTHTDENSDRVGEFAIGTNLGVERVIGNILQDEKFPGIHIAFGNPYGEHTGAPWRSSTHIDVVGLGFNIWLESADQSRSCAKAASSSNLATPTSTSPPIGFGAWAIGGGDWEFSWGPQDDNDSIAAIHRALDLGVNWIDTAAVYGLGHSEESSAAPSRSSSPTSPSSSPSAPWLWNEKREIYQLAQADPPRGRRQPPPPPGRRHRPLPDPLAQARRGDRRGLDHHGRPPARGQGPLDRRLQLQRRADGARSEDRPHHLLQPPYSMLNRAIEAEILPFCLDHNIGVINYSPMHSGLLTGAMTKERVAISPPTTSAARPKSSRSRCSQPQPRPRRTAARDRRCATTSSRRRRRHRLDAAQPGHYRRHRRRPQRRAGQQEIVYIAATKSGSTTAAWSCNSAVMRAAMLL
jgi:hypothetical protein